MHRLVMGKFNLKRSKSHSSLYIGNLLSRLFANVGTWNVKTQFDFTITYLTLKVNLFEIRMCLRTHIARLIKTEHQILIYEIIDT